MKKVVILLLCIVTLMTISAKSYVSLGMSYMKSGVVYDTSTVSSFQLEGKENLASLDTSLRWIPFNYFGFYVDIDTGFIFEKDIVSVNSYLPVLRSNQRLGFSLSYDIDDKFNLAFDVFALSMLNYSKGSYFNKPQWTIATLDGSWGFGAGMSAAYYVGDNSGVFASLDWEKVLVGIGITNVNKATKEKFEHSKAEAYGSVIKCSLGYMWRI